METTNSEQPPKENSAHSFSEGADVPESVPSCGEHKDIPFGEKLKDFKEGKMVLLYKWQIEDLCKASYNKALKDGINVFRQIRYNDTNITDHLGSIIGDGIKEVKRLKKAPTKH